MLWPSRNMIFFISMEMERIYFTVKILFFYIKLCVDYYII